MSEPCANTCTAGDREIARLERQLQELRGVVVGLELDFELDRYQFEALIDWALEADASPDQVSGRLRPDVRTLLWRAAKDYGWSQPVLQQPELQQPEPQAQRPLAEP